MGPVCAALDNPTVSENGPFEPFINHLSFVIWSLYQDRLGTITEKTQKQMPFPLRELCAAAEASILRSLVSPDYGFSAIYNTVRKSSFLEPFSQCF
jgi:hypothetical protein